LVEDGTLSAGVSFYGAVFSIGATASILGGGRSESLMKTATPVTGAFLLVAFADGRYEPSEESRFLSTIANQPALACVNTQALQDAYNLLVGEIDADYAAAADRILAAIASMKDDAQISAAIKVAARGAVVADNRIAPQEEAMLDRIAAALGLKTGDI
jgi:tellurite resistance protein